MRYFLLLSCLLVNLPVFAAWQLDNATSKLSFITIKKQDIAEVHQFDHLQASIDQQGNITVEIDLSSVNTNIAIRDQRMQQFLFETAKFPKASFTTKVAIDVINNLPVGQTKIVKLKGEIFLHGQQQTIGVEAMLARLNKETLMVTSFSPIILNAKDFALVKGVKKLQAIAKLPSISNAVPISFVLTFKQ